MKVVLTGAVCFAAGFAACKLWLEVKLEKKYREDLDEAKAFYRNRYAEKVAALEEQELVAAEEKTPDEIDEPTPHDMLNEVLSPYQTGVLIPKEELRPVPAPKIPTIVRERPKASNPTPVPDDVSKPYIITDEDFFEGYEDHTALTFTYYAGDDTLAAQNDKPVEGKVRIGLIGEGKELLIWDGNKSGDPCVVYIRSHKATADCEVVYSEGKFAEEVLGL